MTVVITVAQQKGGSGKTTLVASLAAAWAASRRVAVLDIDPQQSLSRWHALRAARPATKLPAIPAITLSSAAGWRLGGQIDSLRKTHDVLLIDSPPQVDTDARLAIRAADLVLVPIQPSPPDLWAAEATLKLAADEKRRASIVLNRAPASSRLRTSVEAAITLGGHPVLTAALGNRIGFAGAFAQGMGVTETAPNSVAAQELRAVLAEIEGLLK